MGFKPTRLIERAKDLKQRATDLKDQATEFKNRHSRYMAPAFFVGGFIFDAIMLDRIDSVKALLQQSAYLLIVLQILKFKTLEEAGVWHPSGRIAKYWHYNSEALNFFLGTLLNIYTLFYFVSSSLATSAIFILLAFGLLVLNESPRFHNRNLQIKFGLYSVAIFSFLFIMVAMILEFVGYTSFLLALFIGLVFFYGLYRNLEKKSPDVTARSYLKRAILLPAGIVATTLTALYFLRILPPIPLSIQYVGIYHNVQTVKTDGQTHLILSYDRPWWKFWEHGDQTFVAEPGDRVFCYARIFAPRSFKDEIVFHWLEHTRHGWETQDRITGTISGGRAQGFRTYVYKGHFEPGDWRVQIETTDGRELGRIGLTILAAAAPVPGAPPRQFHTTVQ